MPLWSRLCDTKHKYFRHSCTRCHTIYPWYRQGFWSSKNNSKRHIWVREFQTLEIYAVHHFCCYLHHWLHVIVLFQRFMQIFSFPWVCCNQSTSTREAAHMLMNLSLHQISAKDLGIWISNLNWVSFSGWLIHCFSVTTRKCGAASLQVWYQPDR